MKTENIHPETPDAHVLDDLRFRNMVQVVNERNAALVRLEAEVKDLQIQLLEKDETANIFMNQVKRLHAGIETAVKEIESDALACEQESIRFKQENDKVNSYLMATQAMAHRLDIGRIRKATAFVKNIIGGETMNIKCEMCGGPIHYVGDTWEHVGLKLRHQATPTSVGIRKMEEMGIVVSKPKQPL